MTPQEQYWKERCEAAEDCINKSPCDPDTTDDLAEAYYKWMHIKIKPSPAPAQGVSEADEIIRDIYNRHAAINGDKEPDPYGDLLKGTGKADKVVLSFVRELFNAGSRWQQGQQPAPTCCARWVKASERLPDKELGRVFSKHLGVKNNLHYIFNAWTLSSNAKTIEESDLINIEWLDELPCTCQQEMEELRAWKKVVGWMPGTPTLDKPCVFVSKSGSNYSVWEVTRLNTVDGSYLAICDGDGNEWGDIADFRCDSYYMLSPTIFPTREQAIEKVSWLDKEDPQRVAALTMYDWIIEQINKPS